MTQEFKIGDTVRRKSGSGKHGKIPEGGTFIIKKIVSSGAHDDTGLADNGQPWTHSLNSLELVVENEPNKVTSDRKFKIGDKVSYVNNGKGTPYETEVVALRELENGQIRAIVNYPKGWNPGPSERKVLAGNLDDDKKYHYAKDEELTLLEPAEMPVTNNYPLW